MLICRKVMGILRTLGWRSLSVTAILKTLIIPGKTIAIHRPHLYCGLVHGSIHDPHLYSVSHPRLNPQPTPLLWAHPRLNPQPTPLLWAHPRLNPQPTPLLWAHPRLNPQPTPLLWAHPRLCTQVFLRSPWDGHFHSNSHPRFEYMYFW